MNLRRKNVFISFVIVLIGIFLMSCKNADKDIQSDDSFKDSSSKENEFAPTEPPSPTIAAQEEIKSSSALNSTSTEDKSSLYSETDLSASSVEEKADNEKNTKEDNEESLILEDDGTDLISEVEGALSRDELSSIFTAYTARIRAVFQDEENYNISKRGGSFTLAFIDEDDIPELVISSGNYHAAKCFVFFYDPKTIGTIDCGDTFGETGAFWYFKYKNCVLDNFMAQGIVKTVFCKFKEDHTVERGHTYYFGYDTVKGEEFKTFIDDERVTESEFEKFYEKELEPFKEEESYIASTFGSLGNYETAFSRDTEDILYQLYICLLNQAEPDPKNRYFDYEQNR